MRPDTSGSFAPSDLVLAATLPLLWVVARWVPERRWPGVLALLAGFKPQRPAVRRVRRERIARALDLDAARADRILDRFRAAHLEERLQVLKESSSAGWHPPIRLEGEECLASACSGGRGVLLWVTNAVLAGLVAKKAFHAAGYRLHHLSRPSHGFSTTRFGVRWLNPIRTEVEDRYLAERLVLSAETTVTCMRRLRSLLEQGEVVSITVGDWARRSVELPCLGGRVRLAVGPVHLAAATAAPILPVFMTREDGGFRVRIEEPLPVPRWEPGATSGREASESREASAIQRQARDPAVGATLEAYVRRLEDWLRESPELWNGWGSLA